jgi:outer membrane biosynthesis protein TonB
MITTTEVLSRKERENRNVALVTTLVFHVLLLLLLFFIKAWKNSAMPLSDAGIELNFGLDNVGSGDIQTRNRPSPLKNREESQPSAAEKKQAEVSKPRPVVRELPREEPTKAPKIKEERAEVVSKVESPVKVVEKPATKKVEPQPVTKQKVESKPEPAPTPKPVEAPPRQPDAKAVYKRSSSSGGTGMSGNGTVGTNPNPGGNNNGDDSRGVGDKGSPEGKLDAKALYGKPGSGGSGGSSLSLTGWTWTSRPVVNDPSSETGKIVIQITVDDQGELISVKVVEKTVSQSVADIYKRAVERLSFVPTNATGVRPAKSTGTITFVIRSR